ncbi:MAG: F0F1 ATP synthase subunit A [Burkholderiales bacterium]|nr:MAG: F0F1 ATP synthase subunit A [Burkholderiales bacterium]
MATSGQAPTSGEYIVHHLTHLQNKTQTEVVDFSVINMDSVFWSITLGILACAFMYFAARRATSGAPGRLQGLVEMIYEMVDSQAKGIVHNAKSREFVVPLAMVIFIWIFLMNFMDMLPVDLIPTAWHALGPALGFKDYMRVLPTADLSITMGMAVAVLLICIYYNVKIKGAGGWAHELVSAPFGTSKNPIFAIILGVINFAMQMIEFVAKTVSHGMRLFGNMYAGELIFMLIALLGGSFALSGTGLFVTFMHVVAGLAWTIFHILVITLQAFVFMMLTLVYLGQAHDAH